MKKESSYRIIVRTSLSHDAFVEALSLFGNVQAAFIAEQGGKRTYELTFPSSGRYAKFV